MYTFYKILYGSGSEKYVKSSSRRCEIYLKSPFGNKYLPVDYPYPIADETDYDLITEKQFIAAIANMDFERQPRIAKAI